MKRRAFLGGMVAAALAPKAPAIELEPAPSLMSGFTAAEIEQMGKMAIGYYSGFSVIDPERAPHQWLDETIPVEYPSCG